MKYFKEICKQCSYTKETELTHLKNVIDPIMEELTISSSTKNKNYQIIGSTEGDFCPRCIGLAMDELYEFIRDSKYFKNHIDIF